MTESFSPVDGKLIGKVQNASIEQYEDMCFIQEFIKMFDSMKDISTAERDPPGCPDPAACVISTMSRLI